MGNFREIAVAGVLKTSHNIQFPMVSRTYPAPDRLCHFLINSCTVNLFFQSNHALFQPGNRRNRLKRRTGGLLCLCGIIVQRLGQVILQPGKIGAVHRSRHPVIIVAWIGNQGKYLAGPHIRDNTGTAARI